MRKILFGLMVGLLWIGTGGTANATDEFEVAQINREGKLTSALDADTRDRLRCEGRLHACFPGQGNLDDIFPPVITPLACLDICNENRSSNDNACNDSECFRRCVVAHNLTAFGDTSCQ